MNFYQPKKYAITSWSAYRGIWPRPLVSGGWSLPFQALERRIVHVVANNGQFNFTDGFVFQYRRRT
jgi:hypothetical protein